MAGVHAAIRRTVRAGGASDCPGQLERDRESHESAAAGNSRTEVDEEVEVFSSHGAEAMPKPAQHARLQRLLATMAADLFSSAETSLRAGKESLAPKEKNEPTQSASSMERKENGEPAVASTTKHAPKSVRILLAEDHHINMKVACAVLRKCGHKDITICKDGVG